MPRYSLLFALAFTANAHAIDADPRLAEAELISTAFSQQLLGTVKSAVSAGGTEQAIAVCQVALKARYPDDHAVDYKLGELRGALTLRQRIGLTETRH